MLFRSVTAAALGTIVVIVVERASPVHFACVFSPQKETTVSKLQTGICPDQKRKQTAEPKENAKNIHTIAPATLHHKNIHAQIHHFTHATKQTVQTVQTIQTIQTIITYLRSRTGIETATANSHYVRMSGASGWQRRTIGLDSARNASENASRVRRCSFC